MSFGYDEPKGTWDRLKGTRGALTILAILGGLGGVAGCIAVGVEIYNIGWKESERHFTERIENLELKISEKEEANRSLEARIAQLESESGHAPEEPLPPQAPGATSAPRTVDIIDPPPRSAAIPFTTRSKPVRCHGERNGEAEVVAPAGATGLHFTWSRGSSDRIVARQAKAFGLAAGAYTVRVMDAEKERWRRTVVIEEPDQPLRLRVVEERPATAASASGGAATVHVEGGTGGYRYSWSVQGSSSRLRNLAPGTYSVAVIDSNDCIVTAAVVIGFENGGEDSDGQEYRIVQEEPVVTDPDEGPAGEAEADPAKRAPGDPIRILSIPSPPIARRLEVAGVVVLDVEVNEVGQVTGHRFIQGDSSVFAEQAIKTLYDTRLEASGGRYTARFRCSWKFASTDGTCVRETATTRAVREPT